MQEIRGWAEPAETQEYRSWAEPPPQPSRSNPLQRCPEVPQYIFQWPVAAHPQRRECGRGFPPSPRSPLKLPQEQTMLPAHALGQNTPEAQALAGWSLVWEWGWRCPHQRGRRRRIVHSSPVPTPQMRRNCPWDRLLEHVPSIAHSGWRGRIHRASDRGNGSGTRDVKSPVCGPPADGHPAPGIAGLYRDCPW